MRPARFPRLRPFCRAQSTWRTRIPVTDNTRSTLILGASAAVAGYAGWRMTSGKNSIALDALPQQPSHTSAPLTAHIEPKRAALASAPQPQSSSSAEPDSSTDPLEKKNTPAPDSALPDPAVEPEDASAQEAAFNPDTGEINWDCPCLGGMAHGPCGIPFREAFSCFVFSEEEPKGINCIDKFRQMQECFRQHPDIYGEELMDDEEEEGTEAPRSAQASADGDTTPLADEGDQTTSLQPPSSVSEPLSAPTTTEVVGIPVSNSLAANKLEPTSRFKPPEKQ